MRSLHRRMIWLCLVALAGAIAGGVAGFGLGRYLLLRAARANLSTYAGQLSRHADELALELKAIVIDSAKLPYPRCSDQDLTALRAMTFHSLVFKDIGRTHDGVLYCSAFLGRLAKPYYEGEPTLLLSHGTRVYADVPLILTSGHERASIFEVGDINVVLGPDAFDSLNRDKSYFQISIVDPSNGGMVPFAHSEITPKDGWKSFNKADISRLVGGNCSALNPLCVTTSEDVADVWRGSRAMQGSYTLLGAIAGVCLAFALAMLRLRTDGMRHQLRNALRRGSTDLRLVYQPIVQIGSGHPVGLEALIRWSDSLGRPVSPDVFIGVAEEAGFIDQITSWVIRRSTSELGELLRSRRDLTISINVAATDMNGEKLSRVLGECVQQEGIAPAQLILELTERSTADLGEVRRSIQRLSEEGYQVHIDDFGTGFSNLSYLDQLSVKAIKVDQAFTRSIGTQAVTATILPQIVQMAEALKLDVIIEGVETAEQRIYLEKMGKRMCAQGWHFSRPMAAEDLYVYLEHCDEAELVQVKAAMSCL
jgi:sensor c-di-GMP phosphodiesterase-like protein